MLDEYPRLRDQLRDIYQATREEEWVEIQPSAGRGRGRGTRSRGPWTAEKGFKRGLGKVRQYRQRCEEGLETGKDAEGFMRFSRLVNGEDGEVH